MVEAALYEFQPSFVIGFHGCSEKTGEKVLSSSGGHLKQSEKEYDWLGPGVYFWEGNYARALEWANERYQDGKLDSKPFVIGAIIDLGRCLDLFDRSAMNQVKKAHGHLNKILKQAGVELPKNVGNTPDKAGRKLDCAVIKTLHSLREDDGKPKYDSIRGPFLEGKSIYRGAGFRSHSHIQLCIRSESSIKGYFRPIV